MPTNQKMNKAQTIILLAIIGIADAYMISHPNLLGKMGLWMYNYEMISTFPKALITVLGGFTLSYVLSVFLQKQKGKKWAKYILVFGLIICIAALIQVFFKFSAGSYSHTGKVFKFGMHLYPIILIFIFGEGLWAWIQGSRKP